MLPIEYSKAFYAGRAELLESYKSDSPTGYADLLRRTLDMVNAKIDDCDDFDGDKFDTDRIKSVSVGDYQGSLYFIIPADSYSEGAFTACVSYGSCSHCDAFEACEGCDDGPDYEGYVRLSLHLFQSLKPV